MMKFLVHNIISEVKHPLPEVKLNSGKLMPMLGLGTRNVRIINFLIKYNLNVNCPIIDDT